ncbi:dihydroorotate oxidase [Fibrobacteria bacterium R8-3-H12]
MSFSKNHDYELDFGDKLLAFIRKVFKNQAEFRHSCLGLYAKFSPLWGGRLASKEMAVSFADGSQPINLRSPIVLAAGANKNGKGINNYANLGLGGITVGTATRNFRIGNTHRPRVGLDEANRLIYNSMGLNNDGIEKIAARVEKQKNNNFAVGISVAETPGIAEKDRLQDLLETFSIAYKAADYLEVNASCPNTGEERLDLDTSFMKETFSEIENFRKKAVPRKAVYAKLSPDLTDKQLLSLLDLLAQSGVNGIILGNTYPSEKLSFSLPALNDKGTSGGISGRVIYENTFAKALLAKKHFPKFSIVACGGIDHGFKVRDLLDEGADFVQVYSAFAFRWMAAQKMIYELDFK